MSLPILALQIFGVLALTSMSISILAQSDIHSLNSAQTPLPTPVKAHVLTSELDEMPRFPGCEDAGLENAAKQACAEKAMLRFVYSNVKYPGTMQTLCIEGKVIVRFIVEVDGAITNPQILRSPHQSLSDEVIRVLNSFPKWVPGKQAGKLARVEFFMPVVFKLG